MKHTIIYILLLPPCLQLCLDNWLRGIGPDNHQGCNLVGFALATNPTAWCELPTIQDMAMRWLEE